MHVDIHAVINTFTNTNTVIVKKGKHIFSLHKPIKLTQNPATATAVKCSVSISGFPTSLPRPSPRTIKLTNTSKIPFVKPDITS